MAIAAAADLNREAEGDDAGENSESESIESSMIGGDGPGDVDSSEYDEEAQWREEHNKLQQIFEKQRGGNEALHQNQQRTTTTHCISGSKVKLPYEMLINKLIDGLDTPDLVQNKELPVPNGMQQQPTPPTI